MGKHSLRKVSLPLVSSSKTRWCSFPSNSNEEFGLDKSFQIWKYLFLIFSSFARFFPTVLHKPFHALSKTNIPWWDLLLTFTISLVSSLAFYFSLLLCWSSSFNHSPFNIHLQLPPSLACHCSITSFSHSFLPPPAEPLVSPKKTVRGTLVHHGIKVPATSPPPRPHLTSFRALWLQWGGWRRWYICTSKSVRCKEREDHGCTKFR